ncbi:hypothetical protein VTJ49DRAFT_5432 [Mycothermus thermophilus]|uniref:Zn(2)-C6 fungal-type domain-containing protein n=1 Tax=Humicola insolens TaxID=85995 RepID=A0ABR3VKJ8_HUMIN
MTDIMSYQYPPPPANGTDMDSAGYVSNYSIQPHGPSGIDATPRDRSELRHSISTPVVGSSQSPQQPSATAGQDPGGERRRNKLGYHRTSVACGHCRRRKIRCVPSQNDVQGRCINCIRLKKECSFYPVDQQPPIDTRQKSAPRSSVGPKVPSTSSSPALQSGIPSDMQGQPPYSHLAMPPIQSMAPPMKTPGSDSYPGPKLPSSATPGRPYEYGQQGVANWMSTDASPNSSKPGDMGANWRSYATDSPLTPAFSPYTPHGPPSATWSAPVGNESSRDDVAWSSSYPAPPPRSMSFGADGMAGPQQYPPMTQASGGSSRPYDRKSSSVSADMYPPTVATTIPGIDTIPGTTLGQSVPLSAGAVPPSSYASWSQSYPYQKPAEGYGGWYGEAGDQHPSTPAHPMANAFYGR